MLDEKEIHLRNYLSVIIKRRYTVYTFFAIVFAATLVIAFSATPVYKATTKVLIEKNERAKMTALNPYYMDYDPDFNDTQYQLIKSFSVAQRVVSMISSEQKIYGAAKTQGGGPNMVAGTLQWFRDLFSTILHIGGRAPHPMPAGTAGPDEERIKLKAYQMAKEISSSITVTPVKNSKIVNISYMSSDPKLAALIVNTVAKAYMDEVLDIRMGSSQYALKWLTLRCSSAKNSFGISIDGKGCILPHSNTADIGFAHVGIHLHLGQVLSNGKKGWSLKAGRNRLTHIHIS